MNHGNCVYVCVMYVGDKVLRVHRTLKDVLLKVRAVVGQFVKLSTRSPKDSDVAFRKAVALYTQRSEGRADMDTNERLALLAQCSLEALKVRSAGEALHYMCTSERVREDLRYAFDGLAAHPLQHWDVSLILRPFDSSISVVCIQIYIYVCTLLLVSINIIIYRRVSSAALCGIGN
jgi:hypothetical protein